MWGKTGLINRIITHVSDFDKFYACKAMYTNIIEMLYNWALDLTWTAEERAVITYIGPKFVEFMKDKENRSPSCEFPSCCVYETSPISPSLSPLR